MDLEILYQDDVLVAINKSSGLLVHRSRLDAREKVFALQLLRNQLKQHVYPIHRIDKPTSGVLLFALRPETASLMGEQWSNQVQKRYLAVVRGYLNEPGQIDRPLDVMQEFRSDVINPQGGTPQRAISDYEPVFNVELPYAVGRYDSARFSLTHLYPRTGKRHQLRRHLASIFHPIIGDTSHGDGKQNRFFKEQLNLNGLFLHAEQLCFKHPVNQRTICIQAPLPERFTRFLRILGMQYTH